MDNVTHALTGLALGALATGISVAPGDSHTANAVIWAAAAASQAPDADLIVRFVKGKTSYLKYHRTLSHTLPGLLLSSAAITFLFTLIFPQASWPLVFLWSFISAAAHVLMDLTTSYGTQALWPLSKRKIAWDWVMIIDPVILSVLSLGVLAWYQKLFPTGLLFAVVFGLIIAYTALRAMIHAVLLHRLQRRYPQAGAYSVVPTLGINFWHCVVEKRLPQGGKKILVGHISTAGRVVVEREFIVNPPRYIMDSLKKSELAQQFISFARHLAVWINKKADGYEIVLGDLRYRHRQQYPFAAYIKLSNNLEVLDEDLRYSNKKLTKAVIAQEIKRKLPGPSLKGGQKRQR
ncbi:metal-dependent hydrolase [Desulfofalx alkaliphila]|uniref:metal-dependent hydrolase n=1 Tax=Desulfofalx alkaliphila TaxID=105483 RepID=UPI0004E1BC45|nr:metal-dependent hydrolase [Desulfofalx alkaliphila]